MACLAAADTRRMFLASRAAACLFPGFLRAGAGGGCHALSDLPHGYCQCGHYV